MAEKLPSLFYHKAFRAFWISRVLTSAGFQILAVATGWQMYELTGSALNLGLVGLLEFAPRILFILQIGQVADRFDRRLVSAATKMLQGFVALVLCLLTYTGNMSAETLFILAFLLGTARAFQMPAMQALLPNVVPESMLSNAIASSASAMQVATIVAPALGGFMFAISAALTYGISGLLLLASALLMVSIPKPPATARQDIKSIDHLLAGFKYIRQRKVILGAISLDLFAVLLGGATALLPVFASDILHTGPWGLGLLRSAPAVGALAVSVLLLYFPLRKDVGKIMFFCVIIFGLMTMVFGVSRSMGLSLAALAVLGAVDMVSVMIRSTLVQLETPDAMRGRVSAVNGLFIGASNQLGEFESGLTAHWFGPQIAVVLGGVGTLIIVGLWMKWFPELLQRDRL